MDQYAYSCGPDCSHCLSYQSQFVYQDTPCPPAYPQQSMAPQQQQQQLMHPQSRPSSSGYDQKPSVQHDILQEPQQVYRPAPTYHYTYSAFEASRPAYAAEWLGPQPMAASQPSIQAHQHVDAYAYPQTYQPAFVQAQFGYMPIGQQTMGASQPAFTPIMAATQSALDTTPLAHYHTDLNNGLTNYVNHGYSSSQEIQYGNLGSSPSDNFVDDHSSSSSDSGWQHLDASPRSSFESFVDVPRPAAHFSMPAMAVSNPGLTLHIRTDSNSSNEDVPLSASSFDSFENIPFPMDSPTPRILEPTIAHTHLDFTSRDPSESAPANSPPTSPQQARYSPSSSSHTPPRSRPKRNSYGKSAKVLLKKPVTAGPVIPKVEHDCVEKRGRRKGPLRPEQRKQAGEIRKLRACLRCKFLKKTCDTNEVCSGCKPSHARLWQVPCTRVDIKDLGYFMKGWTCDYERHSSLQIPEGNAQDFKTEGALSDVRHFWVSHGYGFCFPVDARKVIFRDNSYTLVSWSESHPDGTEKYNVSTATMSVHSINANILMEYVDRHVGHKFPEFVRKHFQGTKFLSEMLLTAFNYHQKTQQRVVKKALKLLVAYNLTMQVTFLEGPDQRPVHEGLIEDPSSKFCQKTVAPVLVNEAIKSSLAQMWRDLQRDVLEELSTLFSKVYTGDKLKNWPTIFIVGTLLLAVWEEMQFDAHYREPDEAAVEKFCSDMEKTPVGVITGLFSAISQKVPAFSEWDTDEHHHILGSNEAACDVMSEVREHLRKHEDYLQDRSQCEFDSSDFDSLSNKFLSKLVLKQ